MCSQNLLDLNSASLPHFRQHLILRQIGMVYHSSSEYLFPFCLPDLFFKSLLKLTSSKILFQSIFFLQAEMCLYIPQRKGLPYFTLIWSCCSLRSLKRDALFCTLLHLFTSCTSRTMFSTWQARDKYQLYSIRKTQGIYLNVLFSKYHKSFAD